MNILFTVNFSNSNFYKDFKLSNALLNKHTVLMITNEKQLNDALSTYDLIVVGESSFSFNLNSDKKIIHSTSLELKDYL